MQSGCGPFMVVDDVRDCRLARTITAWRADTLGLSVGHESWMGVHAIGGVPGDSALPLALDLREGMGPSVSQKRLYSWMYSVDSQRK
jgi:hypothetical protein